VIRFSNNILIIDMGRGDQAEGVRCHNRWALLFSIRRERYDHDLRGIYSYDIAALLLSIPVILLSNVYHDIFYLCSQSAIACGITLSL
jgi:hypothetical protein